MPKIIISRANSYRSDEAEAESTAVLMLASR